MISCSEKIQEIERLTRSESRLQILDELKNEDKMKRAELEQRIDVSRTTIQRNLDDLVDQGWIDEERREYSINSCGELISTGFNELLEKIDTAERLQPFFRWMPKSEFGFGIETLVDAEITTSNPGDPYAPVNKHAEALATTEQFHALLPSIGLNPLQVAQRRVVEEDAFHEMIFSERIASIVESNPEYSEPIEEMASNGSANFLVVEQVPSYYVGILDDRVQIGVEDDDGLPRALLETCSEDVRDWARSKFNQQKKEAERLSFT